MARVPIANQLGWPLGLEPPAPPATPGRGGRRPGAGRKPSKSGRRHLPHRPRSEHVGRWPAHVVLRLVEGLRSLGGKAAAAVVLEAITEHAERRGRSFSVLRYAIGPDRLHLLVEASGRTRGESDEHALRGGLSGLATSIARRLNRLFDRHGKVWEDRHYRRDLPSLTALRRVLARRPFHLTPDADDPRTWLVRALDS